MTHRRRLALQFLCAALLACRLAPSVSLAEEPAQIANGLSVDRLEIDAGDVLRGNVVHFEFKLRNQSASPVELHVHPNCGCTVARFDESIPPGGDGRIEAELNSGKLPFGPAAKSISVTLGDNPKTAALLRIKANIVSVVEQLQRDIRPIELEEQSVTSREFFVRTRGGRQMEITGVHCSQDWATAAIEPRADRQDEASEDHSADREPSGRSYVIRLSIEPSAPSGRTPLTVYLATTSEEEPTAMLHVTLVKGIVVAPGAVVFKRDRANPKQTPMTQLKLTRRQGQFRIGKIESPDFDIESAVETVREGQEYVATLVYRGSRRSSTTQRLGSVRIETDDPSQPVIELKATYVVR